MVSTLDDALYNNKDKVDNGFFGDYFVYSLDEKDTSAINYAAFALINATSQDALVSYGAYIH
jgi:hypothetical protein